MSSFKNETTQLVNAFYEHFIARINNFQAIHKRQRLQLIRMRKNARKTENIPLCTIKR